MTADRLTVDVTAKLTVSDETAERCLKLLEMWQDDNRDIIASTDGTRTYYDKQNPRAEITIEPYEGI